MIKMSVLPDCGEALVVFEDRDEEEYEVITHKPGEIMLVDGKDVITSADQLKEGIKLIYITTWHTIDKEMLEIQKGVNNGT